ncbi:DUF1345 domain-containing protein [Cellulosimicrobium sp. NPDC057127]|uniref:DUF1345 domain-containing protein n=1 Tax=Cellulosimicrobium sp. NPDC057127 TaxID=3346026 RepID=UPI00364194E9
MRPPLRSRLVPETVRSWTALVVGVVVSVPSSVVLSTRAGTSDAAAVLAAALGFGVVVAVTFCVLSVAAFSGLRGRPLREALERSVPRWRWSAWAIGGGAAAWSVQFSVLALGVGVGLARGTGAVEDPVVVVLGVALVLSAWATVLVSYTLHYARLDAGVGRGGRGLDAGPRLAFPGDGPRAFADYVYVAAHVSTSFSTGDVTVLDAATRRTVTGHAVVAFAFNAVIVALVVAVLVSG